ncbi:unnamed protein product [Rotaria magnacalcarata]|uniref:Uncharacterized protein n=2 Tax=Rotaria magnacalcarata TaxID=392030 RepID=A0A816XP25_9BILA|nr:unnamed protein product [Rotaria magnacalcarata]CAF2078497.1 unnamed protein product [Rotaria magnacalcarata]CAF2149291.1 unnamed protein product [Rotaria magnacalcarata]
MILQVQASPTCTCSFNQLSTYGLVIKSINLTSREKLRIKEGIIQWLCQSMRPFSIVNDNGLPDIIQQALCLGKASKLRNIFRQLYFKYYTLGAKHGSIDVNSILPHRTTITEHSKIMTNIHRDQLKIHFIELQVFKTLTITPDLWSDKFNSSSYLGITCHIIDSDFSFSTFDLVMHKYTEPDKKAENILIAMNKALSSFDLNLSNTNIICDSGTLNYAATTTTAASTFIDILNSSDDESCDEADDRHMPSIKLKSQRKLKTYNTRTKKEDSSFSFVDHVKLEVSEIPIEAREYLIKLKEVKHIIKYVKKVRF